MENPMPFDFSSPCLEEILNGETHTLHCCKSYNIRWRKSAHGSSSTIRMRFLWKSQIGTNPPLCPTSGKIKSAHGSSSTIQMRFLWKPQLARMILSRRWSAMLGWQGLGLDREFMVYLFISWLIFFMVIHVLCIHGLFMYFRLNNSVFSFVSWNHEIHRIFAEICQKK